MSFCNQKLRKDISNPFGGLCYPFPYTKKRGKLQLSQKGAYNLCTSCKTAKEPYWRDFTLEKIFYIKNRFISSEKIFLFNISKNYLCIAILRYLRYSMNLKAPSDCKSLSFKTKNRLILLPSFATLNVGPKSSSKKFQSISNGIKLQNKNKTGTTNFRHLLVLIFITVESFSELKY